MTATVPAEAFHCSDEQKKDVTQRLQLLLSPQCSPRHQNVCSCAKTKEKEDESAIKSKGVNSTETLREKWGKKSFAIQQNNLN